MYSVPGQCGKQLSCVLSLVVVAGDSTLAPASVPLLSSVDENARGIRQPTKREIATRLNVQVSSWLHYVVG